MTRKAVYEERILKEIRTLPEEALPMVMRLVSLIKEQLLAQDSGIEASPQHTSHERTRELLASSKRNWAHEIIAGREDRI